MMKLSSLSYTEFTKTNDRRCEEYISVKHYLATNYYRNVSLNVKQSHSDRLNVVAVIRHVWRNKYTLKVARAK